MPDISKEQFKLLPQEAKKELAETGDLSKESFKKLPFEVKEMLATGDLEKVQAGRGGLMRPPGSFSEGLDIGLGAAPLRQTVTSALRGEGLGTALKKGAQVFERGTTEGVPTGREQVEEFLPGTPEALKAPVGFAAEFVQDPSLLLGGPLISFGKKAIAKGFSTLAKRGIKKASEEITDRAVQKLVTSADTLTSAGKKANAGLAVRVNNQVRKNIDNIQGGLDDALRDLPKDRVIDVSELRTNLIKAARGADDDAATLLNDLVSKLDDVPFNGKVNIAQFQGLKNEIEEAAKIASSSDIFKGAQKATGSARTSVRRTMDAVAPTELKAANSKLEKLHAVDLKTRKIAPETIGIEEALREAGEAVPQATSIGLRELGDFARFLKRPVSATAEFAVRKGAKPAARLSAKGAQATLETLSAAEQSRLMRFLRAAKTPEGQQIIEQISESEEQ